MGCHANPALPELQYSSLELLNICSCTLGIVKRHTTLNHSVGSCEELCHQGEAFHLMQCAMPCRSCHG